MIEGTADVAAARVMDAVADFTPSAMAMIAQSLHEDDSEVMGRIGQGFAASGALRRVFLELAFVEASRSPDTEQVLEELDERTEPWASIRQGLIDALEEGRKLYPLAHTPGRNT